MRESARALDAFLGGCPSATPTRCGQTRAAAAAAAQRQQPFTDAVVAIAITLLALGLAVPRGAPTATC